VEQAAIIIGGSKFDIVRYLGNGHRHNLPIAYFYQEQLRGMPFALDLPRTWIENKTVLFSMPDTLITPSNVMKKLVDHHYAQQADVTLGLFPTDTPHKFGMVEVDDNGRITHFIDKPTQTHLKYMWGYAAWSPQFTNFMHDHLIQMPADGPECVLSDIFSAALHSQLKIESYIAPGSRYHDIGTPESFQAAVLEMALQQAALTNGQKQGKKNPKTAQ
jgi:glucose-1-phosphate thymidylyltransferase